MQITKFFFNIVFIKSNFYKFLFLLILSLCLMVLESVSLISLASLGSYFSGNTLFLNSIFKISYNFNINEIFLIIIFFVVLKNLLLVLYNFSQARFAGKLFFSQSKRLYLNFTSKAYLSKINNKPEELIRKISGDSISAIDFIFIVFNLIKEFLILIGIITLLYISNTHIVIAVFLVFAFIGLIFFKFFKDFLKKVSNKFINGQTKIISILNQVFGSLKENFIYKNQNYLENKFNKNLNDIKNFYFYRGFIISLPRIAFELSALFAIFITTIILINNGFSEKELINKISLLVVVSLRLIPSFNLITSNLSMIKIYQNFFKIVQDDVNSFELEEKKRKQKQINFLDFKKNLIISNINFSYPNNNKKLFNNSRIKISKNKVIGVFGESGSGKTTLIDFVIGLLNNSNSKVKINNQIMKDGFEFKNNLVGYVPQFPFLLNDTIKNNIIFNRSKKKINTSDIKRAIKLSKLDDLISSLPKKINTIIGHDGIFLSGGQKQRIVIARAILKNPKILILDEATNALDKNTEYKILNDISKIKKDMAIILISHDSDVIKKCDEIYKIENNKIKKLK